jgi:hypothetical protein
MAVTDLCALGIDDTLEQVSDKLLQSLQQQLAITASQP